MKSVIQTRCRNACEFQISDDLNSFPPLFLFSKCAQTRMGSTDEKAGGGREGTSLFGCPSGSARFLGRGGL